MLGRKWDFQKKGKSGWTGTSSFVLEVPLRYLHPSIILFRTMWPDPAKGLALLQNSVEADSVSMFKRRLFKLLISSFTSHHVRTNILNTCYIYL